MARFRLTLLFLLFSLGITAVTVFILNKVSADVGERSLVNLSTKLAETDAQLIGGAVERMAVAEVQNGQEVITVYELLASFASGDPLVELLSFVGPEVLEPLNVADMSLIAADGSTAWTVREETPSGIEAARDPVLIGRAFTGEVVSVLSSEKEYVDQDGSTLTGDIVTTLVPLVNESGSPQFVMSISRDMSDELDAEIASTRASMLKITMASLGGLFLVLLGFIVTIDIHTWRANERLIAEKLMHAEAERDKTELMRLNEAKDRFISTVSHELKTPLTTIMGYAEILHRNRVGNLIDKQLEQIDTLRRAGWRLDLLINDMLDISRIDSGRLTFDSTKFEIPDLIDELDKSFKPIVAQRRQKLIVRNVDTRGMKAELFGDRARVMQCISNLVMNASKYSDEGTTLCVDADILKGSLQVRVRDQGIGITAEDQAKLFTLFFRADNKATRAQPGLGLGLFITAAIVEGHGGSLDVQSEPGVGTTITVQLPGVQMDSASSSSKPDQRAKPTESRLNSLKSA
jgi:signal transduction histidine kinase